MSGIMSGKMPTITQLREATGRTRARVAADLDMSERHLLRLESGKTPIRHILALAFADYYGVPVSEIDLEKKTEAA